MISKGPVPADLRPRVSRPLRRALLALAACVVLLATVETALTVAAYPDYWWLLGGYVVIGAMTALVGILAWDRRPANLSGPLIVVLGLTELLAAVGNIDHPVLIWIGSLAAEVPIAALLHLVLAFPTGRLTRPALRRVVAAAYLVTVGLHSVRLLFRPSSAQDVGGPFADEQIATILRGTQSALVAVLLLAAAVLLVARARRHHETRGERRTLVVVYAYGALAAVAIPLSANLNRWFFQLDPVSLFTIQINVIAAAPIVFAVAVLRGGFARTWGIEELGAWLGAPEARRPPVREALAAALGDPTLQVVFPRPTAPGAVADGESAYIDADGAAVTLPTAPGRGSAPVGDPSAPMAVIVYDRLTVGSEHLVPAAARVMALALQRERLDAELRAGRAHLQAASTRLVTAAETERRRIGQDLHDLVQSHLVLAAVHAGSLPDASPVRTELVAALERLRDVVDGIAPAILVERGLFEAVDELAGRLPLRSELDLRPGTAPLPDGLAGTAYSIVNEALTNVVKHSGAEHVRVLVQQTSDVLTLEVVDDGSGLPDVTPPSGSGLRGIADRVEALGGRLMVESNAGRGTRVHVELPCGS